MRENGFVYDARYLVPRTRVGVGVLLIGGGYAWDLHWTVPPEARDGQGNTIPLTIDGQATRDADVLAFALAGRGLTVLQFSGIRRDDPKRAEDPSMAEPIGIVDSVELTRLALEALRSHPTVRDDRVILVGHSLGMVRACQMVDDRIVGIVGLAGAYLSRVSESTRVLRALPDSYADGDSNGDSRFSYEEFDAWRARHPEHVLFASLSDTLDRDGDGWLRPWELRVGERIAQWRVADESWRDLRVGLRGDDRLSHPEDVLAESTVPVLLVCGGLDAISLHAPLLEERARRADREDLEIQYFANLGHQLSAEREDLVGPIDPSVVELVSEWALEEARAGQLQGVGPDPANSAERD